MLDRTSEFHTLIFKLTQIPRSSSSPSHHDVSYSKISSKFTRNTVAINKQLDLIDREMRLNWGRLGSEGYFYDVCHAGDSNDNDDSGSDKVDTSEEELINIIESVNRVKDDLDVIKNAVNLQPNTKALHIDDSTNTTALANVNQHRASILQILTTKIITLQSMYNTLHANRTRSSITYSKLGLYRSGLTLKDVDKDFKRVYHGGLEELLDDCQIEFDEDENYDGGGLDEGGGNMSSFMKYAKSVINGNSEDKQNGLIDDDDDVWDLSASDDHDRASTKQGGSDSDNEKGRIKPKEQSVKQAVKSLQQSSSSSNNSNNNFNKSLLLESLVLPQKLSTSLSSALTIESSVSSITHLLTTFSSLLTEQSYTIETINTNVSNASVDVGKGKDELVTAVERMEKGTFWMSWFIVLMAVLLLLLNRLTP